MRTIKTFTAIAAIIFSVTACKKTDTDTNNPINGTKLAPDGFNFTTTKTITIDVNLLSNNNGAISGVPVSVYAYWNNEMGNKLLTTLSNKAGKISAQIQVPSYIDTLIIDPNYLGLLRNTKAYINNNSISATIGGINGFSGNIVGSFSAEQPLAGTTVQQKDVLDINGVSTNTVFKYLGTTDNNGKPNYLESPRDVISSDLLAAINNSLPESQSVPNLRPSYLSNNATSNLVIVKRSDVWITFVHEGAGYRNSLGFYKYPTNNPPASLADIDTITFIYPNTSYTNSGGNLTSGDKVKIGTFDAGTTIGIVLYQDAWKGGTSNNVRTTNTAFFSDSYLNPESTEALRKHSVLLTYNDYLLVGFEDINRSYGSCDQDFNDVVYYASSNPIDAISREGVKPVDRPVDTDGDGVNDPLDEFPNDPTRAYINYFPNVNQWGTLAFEDQWPNSGDYDMNDLVVRYRYKMISNASNNVVEMTGEFAPIAAGANFQNGFGVEFPFSTGNVSSVTYANKDKCLRNNYITLNANGTEAGQTKAVIIPFDNSYNLLSYSNGSFIVNTDKTKDKISGDTSRISIVFTAPISTATLGTIPFNPFLISNMRRTYEVHLPGTTPTNKADANLLGTGEDASRPSQGKYYVNALNYPWALSFVEPFEYPKEVSNVKDTYLFFTNWAGSGGTTYTDWYKNTQSGYRASNNIY